MAHDGDLVSTLDVFESVLMSFVSIKRHNSQWLECEMELGIIRRNSQYHRLVNQMYYYLYK